MFGHLVVVCVCGGRRRGRGRRGRKGVVVVVVRTDDLTQMSVQMRQ